jgi:hypothetical protein
MPYSIIGFSTGLHSNMSWGMVRPCCYLKTVKPLKIRGFTVCGLNQQKVEPGVEIVSLCIPTKTIHNQELGAKGYRK